MKRKHIAKREYRYSPFPTDKMADEFFKKYPTPMERFEAVLNRIAQIQLEKNPCPFKDCPNEKTIAKDNIVQYHGMRFDAQECLARMQEMKNDQPFRWCYFDEEGLSHHVYKFNATSKKGINLCYCGYKETIYDIGEKGWVFRYHEDHA